MGIPKFFRWMSEKYPGLCKTAKSNQLPEIDNFYLDMNGIIHNCSHPCDGDVQFRITEAQMFEDIFDYVDVLFCIIKPRKYFFLAVDGVAPRAKMNQQRGRRFRSVKEAHEREEAAIKKGQKLPPEQRFDSNCITPGTDFMIKLNEELKAYIQKKLLTDPSWKKVKVILSGHEAPGEGEHKIMDFIRYQRSQPGYNPETSHCLYGLDTDLIMLGLSSHEPNFLLLREEQKFNKATKTKVKPERANASKMDFNILYLALLREYIEKEYLPLKPKISFKFDLENIIDDWILICFLVGNDFIPHIPHFHIHTKALPRIFKIYQSFLTKSNGYLNERGILNLSRFRKFCKTLVKLDRENMTSADGHPPQSKFYGGRRVGVHSFSEKQINDSITLCADGDFVNVSDEEFFSDEKFPGEQRKPKNRTTKSTTQNRVNNDASLKKDYQKPKFKTDFSQEEDEFLKYKLKYYEDKFKIEATPENILKIVQEYVRALQWNLHYYYHGCISWGWFYPYHYAPLISDVVNFTDVNMKFELGQPFKPFEQLLSVLPPASSDLLPKVYRSLVTEKNSPLVEFFPEKVEYDLNGKQNDWEAVVLAPFIDEKALLNASLVYNLFLTERERANNVHGPHFVFEYVPPDREKNTPGNVNVYTVPFNAFNLPINKIKFGLLRKDIKNDYIAKLKSLNIRRSTRPTSYSSAAGYHHYNGKNNGYYGHNQH